MKKKIAILTTIAVLAIGTIGGTLAYFNAQTNEVKNVFTASSGLKDEIDLKEYFLKDGADDTVYSANAGNLTDSTFAKFVPNQSFIKEPWVTNDADIDAYVAVKISFIDAEGNSMPKATFDSLATLVGTSDTNWKYESTTDGIIAYYKDVVKAKNDTDSDKTVPVFTDVKIKSTVNDATIQSFNIVLKAYAVQVDLNDNAKGDTVAKKAYNALYQEFFKQ